MHDSSFKDKHFAQSSAKKILKLNNTINGLNIILHYF